jgi:hypothetical protein
METISLVTDANPTTPRTIIEAGRWCMGTARLKYAAGQGKS